MRKRFICAVLAAITLLFSSCGGASVKAPANETDAPEITAAETTEETSPPETEPPAAPVIETPANSGVDIKSPSDMPAVYITLDNKVRQSAIPRNEYIPASFTLDGFGIYDDISETPVSIKGRGNYSWGLPKKPYNIIFEEKLDLCDMGKARKWTLIANWSDKTLMRNYLTLNLSLDVGISYASECRMINFYVNDKYQGIYLLTERVELHKQRVDEDETLGGVLFEIETPSRHGNQCENCVETKGGVHLIVKEPSREDIGDEAFEALLARVAVKVGTAEMMMSRGAASWERFLDVDTFVNWYIVNEFVKNFDSIFVTSCYGYIDEDGRVCMGPPWDFDTCMGNQDIATCLTPTGFYIKDAPWFSLFYESEDFVSLVKAKWTELRENGVIDRVSQRIDEVSGDYQQSIELNFNRWPDALEYTGLRGDRSLHTFDKEVVYLKTFIKKRTEWLDSQWLK